MDIWHTIIQGALDFVQDFGLIHRDIKPENFFYRDINDPLNFGMADFGLAIVLPNKGPDDSLRFYEIAGTPGYAAPEVFRKTGYGKKSDVVSAELPGRRSFRVHYASATEGRSCFAAYLDLSHSSVVSHSLA